MKALLKNSLWLLLTSWIIVSCVEQTVYHTYQSIPDKGWDKYDTLSFVVPITDSLPQTYRLAVEVRNGNTYPYRNLHIVVAQNLQDSTVFITDTLSFSLADTDGNWKSSAWGVLRQSSSLVGEIRLHKVGTYTVRISHGMKDDLLPGIRDVGVYMGK